MRMAAGDCVLPAWFLPDHHTISRASLARHAAAVAHGPELQPFQQTRSAPALRGVPSRNHAENVKQRNDSNQATIWW
jgi:hypothetical protein